MSLNPKKRSLRFFIYFVLGFIIPGENGARPRLQLIPGTNIYHTTPLLFHTLTNEQRTYFQHLPNVVK